MTLYHVTHRRNQASIDAYGLDPLYATHKEQAVWLVSRSTIAWALAHTAAKPGRGRVNDLIVYKVEIGRKKVRRYRRGIWRSFDVVHPSSVEPSSTYTDSYPN